MENVKIHTENVSFGIKISEKRETNLDAFNEMLKKALKAGISIDRMMVSIVNIKSKDLSSKQKMLINLSDSKKNQSLDDKADLIVLKYLYAIK